YRDASASFESQIVHWTNVQRRSHGLLPVRAGSCVDRYAESWVHHLAGTRSFHHQRLGPILGGCGARVAGENLAWGTASARTTVARWMRSPGHRKNLLDGSFTRLGVGAAYAGGRRYTVQDFTG
ncbi:MAG: CAP domain-containing protein, partial [Nocardioidaceae bacterium]